MGPGAAVAILFIGIVLIVAFCIWSKTTFKSAQDKRWEKEHAKSALLHEARVKAYWDAEPARQAAKEKADAEHKAFMLRRLDEGIAEMKRKREQS